MYTYNRIEALDEYFDYKKTLRIQEKVFYALPRYTNEPEKKYVVPEN
jgi:hypothetical protein